MCVGLWLWLLTGCLVWRALSQVLPEAFTGTYGVEHFARNSEILESDGSGSALLATIASQHRMHVVGGVIERCLSSDVLFNSTVAYDTSGSLVAKYRKIHLSKVRVGADDTSEASVLQEGNSTASFKIPVDVITNGDGPRGATFAVGLACCFDLRFPELAGAYARWGNEPCDVLLYPSAFLASTGEKHWELMLRTRALDGQFYTVGSNHALDVTASDRGESVMWGHSIIADPWGAVVAATGGAEDELAIADLERNMLKDVQSKIDLGAARRPEAYKNVRPQ
jgi:predicted amidohydrolase